MSTGIKGWMNWGVALATVLLVSVLGMPMARGELVFEDEQSTETGAVQPQQVVGPTAPVAQSSMPPQVQVQAVPQPPMAQMAASPEVENMTRSELLRRERMRQELKNEDVLQERLEELRLRDEKRRTDQIVSGSPVGEASAPVGLGAAAPQAAVGVTQETVVPTVLDKPGQGQQAVAAPMGSDVATLEASSHDDASSDPFLDKRPKFTIAPRGGVAGILGSNGLNVVPRFSVGLGAGVELNDHLAFEVGYTFSEYGVGLMPTNGFVLGYMAYAGVYGTQPETQVMRQNIFDAGMKLHVLGRDSRLRPYLTGGGAYAKSFINWDDTILRLANPSVQPWLAQDYAVDAFLGYLGVGLDLRITKSISISAQGRYYAVLTARENSALNPANFYGNNGGIYSPVAYMGALDYDKERTGASLSNAGFFTIQAGLTFQF